MKTLSGEDPGREGQKNKAPIRIYDAVEHANSIIIKGMI